MIIPSLNAIRDAEICRLYHVRGLCRMRIAKIFDCRMREVNAALARYDGRLPPGEFADAAFRQMTRRSSEIQEQRRGKSRPISHVQNAATGKRSAPVSLPRLTILEGSE